jgi:signal transduction histidine kinase
MGGHFGAILMQAPTPICVTRGPQHRLEIMNHAFEAVCGTTDGWGRPFREVYLSGDVEAQLRDLDRVLRTGERVVASEVPTRAPAGGGTASAAPPAERYFNLVYEPLRDSSGAVDGVMLSAIDVTAHVQGRKLLEQAQERSNFLVDASAALSESLDYLRTLRRVAELAVPRIADWCTVSAIDESGVLRRIAVVHSDPSKRALVEEYEQRFPPTDHRAGHLTGVIKENRAMLRPLVPDAELVAAAQSADHLRILRGLGCASCIIVPMVVRGEAVGAISLMRSDARQPYGQQEVSVAEELAHRAGLAVDNARLYREAQRREQTMRFFAEASALLNSSLDYDAAFEKVARLVVPSFADWCAVDVKEDARIRQVAVAHVNPDKVRLALELQRRYPPDPEALSGSPNVLRTGQSELYEDIPDELLVRGSRDAEHLRISRALGLRSALVVPLVGRGAPIGALTMVWAESGHRYRREDLLIMEELGRRAGLALENARLYRETQSAVRLRDEFISIASHELKTPLTSMQLQISGIRRSAESPARLDPVKLARRVEVIDKQVGRLTELVDGLLDVSRASAGRLQLNLEEIDLVEVIRHVLERFSDQLAAAGCRLSVELPREIRGRWDRLRLDDVVTNLVGNAVKYGAGQPIELAAGVDSGMATVRVRDHGIGIAPDDQQRIFERFARAVSADHYGGFGLGLWIVQVLVDAMGGSVAVESVVGEGASFTVKLPLGMEKS